MVTTAQNQTLVKLVIEDDEGKRTVVPITRDEITIGRKDGNTIRLTERNVSRFHARLLRQETQLFVEDLNSYNGIRINGDRISGRAQIHEGDLIEIGDYHLALQTDGNRETLAGGEDGEATVRMATPEVGEETVKMPVAPEPEPSRAEPTALIRPDELEPPPSEASAAAATTTIPESERAKLVVVATNLAGTEYQLEQRESVIGRTEDNDVIIDHRSVSRNHAKIVYDGNKYTIIDLKSANGVLVNGEEYTQTTLRPGDILELGHVQLRFIEPGGRFRLSEDEIASIKAEVYDGDDEAPSAGLMTTDRFPRGPIDDELRKRNRLIYMVGGAGGVLVLFILIAVFAFGGEESDNGAVVVTPPPKNNNTANPDPKPDPKPDPPKDPVPQNDGPKLSAKEIQRRLEGARTHLKGGRFDEADVLLGEVLVAAEGHEQALTLKERLIRERQAEKDFEAAKADIEDENIEQALAKLEAIAEGTYYRGQALKLAGKIKSGLASEYFSKGQLALQQERYADAEEAVAAGLAVTPQNRALNNLKRKIADAQRKPVATNNVKKPPKNRHVKRNPKKVDNTEDAQSFYHKGNRAILQGRFREAVDQFKRALQSDPKYADAHRGLGIAYARLKKPDQAVRHYELYVKKRPYAQDADKVREILKKYQTQRDPG